MMKLFRKKSKTSSTKKVVVGSSVQGRWSLEVMNVVSPVSSPEPKRKEKVSKEDDSSSNTVFIFGSASEPSFPVHALAEERLTIPEEPSGNNTNAFDSTQDSALHFLDLPSEILLLILQYLDIRDLCRLSACCKTLHTFGQDDVIWRQRVEDNFPTHFIKNSWKSMYHHEHRIDKNKRKSRFTTTVMKGHTDIVRSVQYDPVRNVLVSSSRDRTVKIWNMETKKCIRTLSGHSNSVYWSTFKDDKIISCSKDGTLKVWNFEGECRQTLRGHADSVISIAYDGKRIVSGSSDRTMRVWNPETGQCTMTFNGHNDLVSCIQIDDEKVISGSVDCVVRVFDPRTRTIARSTILPTPVFCLQYDAEKVLAGCYDRTVHWIDHQSPAAAKHVMTDHRGWVFSLNYDQQTSRMITGSFDKSIKLWDLNSRQCLATYFGHNGFVSSLQADHSRIYSGSADKTIRVWDFDNVTTESETDRRKRSVFGSASSLFE